ncbi:hypothetical protein GCM10017714_15890 [Curtobacterium pusillum]|nr:hypothetical protein GCM10017610_11340 [Curtobacterium pusillum]
MRHGRRSRRGSDGRDEGDRERGRPDERQRETAKTFREHDLVPFIGRSTVPVVGERSYGTSKYANATALVRVPANRPDQ